MIQLSDHFNYKRLIRFTIPSIIMMIFTSIYSIVDGIFVANFAGDTAFAAVNLIMPVLMILGCIGFMFGTGGSALISKTLGEKNPKKANEVFSLIVYTAFAGGVILAILGIVFLRPIATLIGGTGKLLENSVLYGRIILCALPFFVLQYAFQCLFITAEKPKLGLYTTIISGVTNMILDGLFVGILPFGLAGAAVATAISQFVGGIIPIIYFNRKNSSLLRLVKCKIDWKVILKTCTNGSSELTGNISMSIVSMLYNLQLIKLAGQNGISAYGILMYVSMIFQAIFIGYSVGISPVIGFHYGAQNHKELKSLLKKSITLICICSIIMFIAGEILGKPFSIIFAGNNTELLEISIRGFSIFSFSFLFSGLAILSSSFFTSLNDGLTSALISFLRTLVFQIGAVFILPVFLGMDGIWLSIVVAEIMAVIVSFAFLYLKRNHYKYF